MKPPTVTVKLATAIMKLVTVIIKLTTAIVKLATVIIKLATASMKLVSATDLPDVVFSTSFVAVTPPPTRFSCRAWEIIILQA